MLNVALTLKAFEPEADDFENTFQYNLYQSWLKKGDFKTNFPAGFGNKKIEYSGLQFPAGILRSGKNTN